MSDELLTTKQAAQYLDVVPRTLNNWRYLLIGPPYLRIGRRAIRYEQKDLEAFKQRITPELEG